MNRFSWRSGGDGEGLPDVLWEDGDRRFCRIWRQGSDGGWRQCIAVLPATEHPAPGSVARLAHEYALRADLDGAWALRPLELVREGGQTLLVLEHHDGDPLDGLIRSRMDIGRWLRLGAALSAGIVQLHRRGLIHKDIKPANVLVDTAGDRVWLTGFGVASRVTREHQSPEPPELIAGTLSHMSPEQTGRIDRSIDSRSDLYSLGVTLYQALTGSLPFSASDAMEWVHCHLAKRPAPLEARVADVPPSVAGIIMKLLAKTPEARYQTAAGVEHDIRRCLADWQARRAIDEFPLGERDRPDRLLIPERLYGRESQIDALLAAFDEVAARGTPALVLVRGHPGIGKSAVVNQLGKALVPPRGLFASGKFDELQRDVPYATLAQAFQSLVRRLLGKPAAELGKWRDELRQALDPNAALVVALVPELAFVIGEQPAVPELPPLDAKARYQLVLRRLIGVFARPAHPLALFVDDLQWLDAATLDLLEDVLVRRDPANLLLVAAYRDNELDAAHPLVRTLAAIRESGARVEEIALAPLSPEVLGQLISDAVCREKPHAMPLAQLVHEKTAGNPFFANQFIHALVDEELLSFDTRHGRWQWDLRRIQAKGYTENVVDLMIGKLSRLPANTRELLKEMACLGTVVTTSTLAVVHGAPERKIHDALWEAVRSELIARSEDAYRFAHDRIREAAYSLIPAQARAQAHLRIGKLLAAQRMDDKREDAIFDIVGQLNRGCALLESNDEREQLAELNLIAARRAKAAAAAASALNYLLAGAALMADGCRTRRHDLWFQLELNRAECEFLTGELTTAATRIDTLRSHAADAVERALVACLSIDVYTTLGQSDRAIAVCLDYLARVGIEWPSRPSPEDVHREYERIRSRIESVAIHDLVDLPLMTDPASLATMDVLAKALPPAHFTDTNLLALAICRMINLSLDHGNTDASCFAYVWFGLIAGPRFGDYPAAFQLGRVGYELVETRGLKRFQASTYMCFGHGVMPWTEDFRACGEMMRRTFVASNRSGELTYAAYSCNALNTELLAAGEELEEVQREAERGLAFAQKARFGLVVDVITAQLAFVRTLRGLTPRFGSFDDGQFDEGRFENHLASAPNLALPECWYWIRQMQARFFAGDHAAAARAGAHAKGLLWTSPSLLETAEYHFYAALSCAALCESAPAEERHALVDALLAHHAQIGIWAGNCPGNFETRAALVGAEIARIEGRTIDAETLYELAIRSAHVNGLVHNEALATELAADFYAARGFDKIARAYMRDARGCYRQWGAEGKVRQLDERFPYLGGERVRSDPTQTVQQPLEHLDLAAVLKVLQAVSGETDLDKLISTVMRLAMEHAGAERALLILPQGDSYRIEAEARIADDLVTVALRLSDLTAAELPQSVFRYVVRTGESLVLHDASAESPFADDEYIRSHGARSVLCMPLLEHTRLVGVIYLENNVTSGAFTRGRMALLKVLVSDAAIALENARLYRDVRVREARFRRLVDSNIIGIAVWHTDGRVMEANEAFLRITGHERDDVASGGVRWTDLTPPEWQEHNARAMEEVRHAGTIQPQERELFRKDGSRVHVLVGGATFDDSPEEGVAFVLDLTGLKRAEQALRESERESRLIVDSIPGLVAVFAPSGELQFVNRQILEYYGLALEQLKHWETSAGVTHPEDLPRAVEIFSRSIASGEPFEVEVRARRFDGVFRWFQSRGFPLRDTHGRIVRWYNLLIDIDERKRAEADIAASERDLKLIIDTIPALAWSARPDGSAEFFSQHYLDFIGLSAQQAGGWGWTAAVHPEDLGGLAASWEHIMKSEAPGETEARLHRHDGEYRWFLFRANPLRDDNGRIVKWYGVNTDIEDRKRAEAELRRAYDSFADGQRLSRTGNFTADIMADDHIWSAELYRIFEFDPSSKVTVQRVRESIHPEDLPSFDAGFARSLGGVDFDLVFRIVTGSAKVKYVRAVAHLIERVAGRPLFIGNIQDVTEGKVAEDALDNARAELARVARVTTLGALTASIAHEVNQPLSGIITNASTCLRMLDANPSNVEGARETARRIIRDGNRASEVITRLRALFTKKEFTLEALDLNEATREVIALSLSDLQRNRVILQAELADDLPKVRGDRVQVQQVLLNLLRNASDAMVDVDDRPRHLLIRTEQEDDDRVRVTVRDAGVGIDQESIDRIFDAFYTTKSGGMGIGLSVSRSIVERHHGRLWVERNDGPGATFSFSIPCAPRSATNSVA